MANVGVQNHIGVTHQILQYGAPITSSSVADPTVITCDEPHQFASGDSVVIADHAGDTPDIDDTYVATVIDTVSFTIPIEVTVGGNAGFAALEGDFDGADNSVVLELENAERYNEFTLMSGAGAMDVDVSLDGTNFAPAIAMIDVESADPATRVVATVAGKAYRFAGTFKTIRVLQKGATEVGGAVLWCGIAGRG